MAMVSWGCSQSHPSGPPGSRPQGKEQGYNPPAGASMKLAEPASPNLPQVAGEGQRSGGGRQVRVGGKGSGLSVLFLGLLCLTSYLRGPSLSAEGWQGFRRFPACQLLQLFQKCRPGKPSLEAVGTEGARGHKPRAFPAGPGVCADSPEPTLLRGPSLHLSADKGAALFGLPSPEPSQRHSSARSGRTLPLHLQGQKGASV